MGLVVFAAAIVLALAPGVASATTRIPHPEPVRRAVEAQFLRDGKPDAEKIDAARSLLRGRLEFVQQHIGDYEHIVDGEKKKKARRKAADHDLAFALGYALELLDRLEQERDRARVYRLGTEILTLDFATRSYRYPLGSVEAPITLYNLLVDWSIDAGRSPRGAREASNLVDPASGEFYTPVELDALIAAGEDLSLLDPPGDGLLWRPVEDVASLDVAAHYLGGGDALHGGTPSVFPDDGAEVDFAKVRMTQTKPKIDVYWHDEACRALPEKSQRKACRRKYKLKFGNEINSDPVANALLAALGFNADVSVHRKNMRVRLGKTDYEVFRSDWENYFDEQGMWTRIDLSKALLPGEEGRQRERDDEILVFRAAGVEAKPERLRRIGGWSNGLISRSALAIGMREARGLAIFNVWIANTDLKDAENNKVILRRDEAGEWRMFMNLQDAGTSLGRILAEKVDAFPWDVVERDWLSRGFGAARGRVELNYFALQQTGLYQNATWSDHKWMVRRIARLSRVQIEAAVALGRFPGGVGPLYVEKLVHRRNQLVERFGLADEYPALPVDRKLTTADGSVVDGRIVVSVFPEESPTDFGDHTRSLVRPMGPILWRELRRMVAASIGAIGSLGGEIRIEGDLHLYPALLINLQRHVVPNPAPVGELDRYIVEGAMTIGVRLGVGYIGQGRATVQRRYRLAYTAASEWQGRLYRNQALNWFLPREARRGELPERYVLLRDTEYGPGIAVTSSDPATEVFAGADAGADWLLSRRTVLEARPEGAAVWIDSGSALRGSASAWVKIYPIRLTFFETGMEAGRNRGEALLLERRPDEDDALDAAVAELRRGRPAAAKALGAATARSTEHHYASTWRELDLTFWVWRQRDRLDRIRIADPEGNPGGTQLQSLRQRHFRWKFLDNGEAVTCDIEGFLSSERPVDWSEGDEGDWGPHQPRLVASFLVDDRNTHSDELDAYHGFLQSLGGGERYLAGPFAARDWEQTGGPSGRWGRILAEGQLVLDGAALEALLAIDPADYWRTLADRLEIDEADLLRARDRLFSRDLGTRRRAQLTLPGSLRSIVWRSQMALRDLEKARRADGPRARMSHLTRVVKGASCFRGTRARSEVIEALLAAIDLRRLAKERHAVVHARIGTAVEDENTLPGRRDFVGKLGKRRVGKQIEFVAEPFGPVELYHMLGWVRGEPKRAWIAPEVLR